MKFIFESAVETQKTSLEVAAGFTDTCLLVAERLARLNWELTREAFEKSSEIVLLCLHVPLSEATTFEDGADYAKPKKSVIGSTI